MMLRREKRAEHRGGFTLMEMLVVVAIIVILAGAAVPIYFNQMNEARRGRAKMDVTTIAAQLEAYNLKSGSYPDGLESLTEAPPGGVAYLKPEALMDPWSRPYQYDKNGTHNAAYGKPDVWSTGSNANDPTNIIGNWSQ